MKGRKGESPMSGVGINTSTVPQTAKGNILSAARKRKRGGAVAPLKVDGTMPKARLDKPKRARGGAAEEPNIARLRAKANAQLADAMSKRGPPPKPSGDNGEAARKALKAIEDGMKPKRQRGGKVGADTSPMTHAAHEKPMRGHKTQPNIT